MSHVVVTVSVSEGECVWGSCGFGFVGLPYVMVGLLLVVTTTSVLGTRQSLLQRPDSLLLPCLNSHGLNSHTHTYIHTQTQGDLVPACVVSQKLLALW
jgi:hypothetical protein